MYCRGILCVNSAAGIDLWQELHAFQSTVVILWSYFQRSPLLLLSPDCWFISSKFKLFSVGQLFTVAGDRQTGGSNTHIAHIINTNNSPNCSAIVVQKENEELGKNDVKVADRCRLQCVLPVRYC